MTKNTPLVTFTHIDRGRSVTDFFGALFYPAAKHCEPAGKIEPQKNLSQNPPVYVCDCVSTIVVNKKNNGKIRLCLDSQPLNKALKRCHYPIPMIEDVLPDLANAKVFTKLVCKNGYWQVKLDKVSSMLTTFNTPFGHYKSTRMPFRISPAGEIFQRPLDQAMEGLAGVRMVADDLLIIGNGESVADAVRDHDTKLEALLGRCRERGIKLNEAKISLEKIHRSFTDFWWS